MSCFTLSLLRRIGIDEAHIPTLTDTYEKLCEKPAFPILCTHMGMGDYENVSFLLKGADALAAEVGCHPYTAHFLLLAGAAETLREQYAARGVDEAIYWDTIQDLRWKFDECVAVHGVPGTCAAGWQEAFFRMTRFTLGRFQYHFDTFDADTFTHAGITVRKGDPVYRFHIPSAGPMPKEVRLASYRRAYEFYKDQLPADGVARFTCDSWLLYPAQREFLPKKSNILSFMEDFRIVRDWENETFDDAWRVFASAAKNPPETWPRDTGLQRAFADRILSGGKTGGGYGLILFDGEKIL